MAKTDEDVAKSLNLTAGQVQQMRAARGMTLASMENMPEARIQRLLRRLEFPDLPRARQAFRLLQQKDDQGSVPPDAIMRAVQELDSQRRRVLPPRPKVAGIPTGTSVVPGSLLPPTAGLHPDHTGWKSLGPGNIGGRTRSIVIHPTQPDIMWAGSVGGGVWRTDNAGQSWQPMDDLMANLAITCLVIDPTQPRTLYAGTGEGFSNVDAIRGAGIFQTVNGGERWAQLPATSGNEFRAINHLALSRDGITLFAATPAGLFRSSGTNRLSWAKILAHPLADVKVHPVDGKQLVAGSTRSGKAFFSTDGGNTWNEASHTGPWGGRVELTYAVANPSIVYASVQTEGGEIWRSTNGGRSFEKREGLNEDGHPAGYLGDQGWYDNVIWASDPTNADFVLVGGIDLWKSTDGGQTLTDISTWWSPQSVHADQHCIVAHPQFDGVSNKTVFFGNDGGVFKTDDIHTAGNDQIPPRIHGWHELDNTYGVTQFYGAAGHAGSGVIIGGAQDNGTLRFTPDQGTEQWSSMFGGDGGWCASDPNDPQCFYGEYVFLNIHRSTDGGKTADFISGQAWNGHDWIWKPVPFRIPDAKSQDALFIAPFILDPNDSNRLLAGGLSLWRTNNAKAPNTLTAGPLWASIKNPVGSHISAIAVASGDQDLAWVGHEDGQICKTGNASARVPVWQRVDGTGPSGLIAKRMCTRVVIDPSNHARVYVTFGGYQRGNVWKTEDGGATWHDIGAGLPEVPVRSLAIHPRRSDFLFIGTEVGAFASDDAGASWSAANEGPTSCSVDDLFWMNETLVCATHGRGMFQINLNL